MSTNHATRQRVAPDDFTHNNALLRWKNQPQPEPTSPLNTIYPAETPAPADQPLESTEAAVDPSLTRDTGEEILRLLREGESVDQISTQLQISKTMVKRLQRQLTSTDVEKIDGRRLYNDTFKQVAIQQINQGVSVRQLSIKLGVSQVTLHKWKSKAILGRINSPTAVFTSTESQGINSLVIDPIEPLTGSDNYLHQELQALREERDILKKALVILLRSS